MKMTKMVSVGALVLLLAGWGFAPVLAQESASADNTGREVSSENTITFFEDVADDFGDSVDVYLIRCTQASDEIHVVVTDSGTTDDNFTFSLVGTVPASMLGQGEVEYVAAGGNTSDSLFRPGPKAGAMRALLSVWGNGSVDLRSYTMAAECINDIKGTRNTVVTLLQDE